ncbi:MAG TPA: DUF1343 domain-containing protein [Bdellovibrionota bacterium]|jgi:uncharacterized protein YbbC (DUF1343 family)|nr:DUF1343 domain-containing protein [Bdellovibrionota bacterium]
MSSFKFGIEKLLSDPALQSRLKGKRVALLGHPASICRDQRGQWTHSLDALGQASPIKLTAAFGPQHGMRGDKQDNMIESPDFTDPALGIPVFSLYGKVRRPTPAMLDTFDVLLVDLQDVGCRIYTYLTTLGYLVEDCARAKKALWVLDRPNPAGRPAEGTRLESGWESFVGLGPMVMRHGLTLAEAALWWKGLKKVDLDLQIVKAEGYSPSEGPGYGWPEGLPWVNPSPNASSLNMARCFAGTVLLEGTTLSEGRGTTVPLEVLGAPELDSHKLLSEMHRLEPHWMEGAWLRPCTFEPTFHKHVGKLCNGFQIHAEQAGYDHGRFRPFRLVALALKAVRNLHPGYDLWRSHAYEYENRLPIHLINGGELLQKWVDDRGAKPADLERALARDEASWDAERRPLLIY